MKHCFCSKHHFFAFLSAMVFCNGAACGLGVCKASLSHILFLRLYRNTISFFHIKLTHLYGYCCISKNIFFFSKHLLLYDICKILLFFLPNFFFWTVLSPTSLFLCFDFYKINNKKQPKKQCCFLGCYFK